MSTFAGKQTFRTTNSNDRLILKADVQVESMVVATADVSPSTPLLMFVLKISSQSKTDRVFIKVVSVKTFAVFQITADVITIKISDTHSH